MSINCLLDIIMFHAITEFAQSANCVDQTEDQQNGRLGCNL